MKFELAFVTLPYFPIPIIHLRWFLHFVLLWVLLSVFPILLFCHLLIHLSPNLFGVRAFQLISFLLRQGTLQFLPFFLICFLFSFLQFSLFYCFIQRCFEHLQILHSFNPLGRSDDFSIITLKCGHICNEILLATWPILAWIPS